MSRVQGRESRVRLATLLSGTPTRGWAAGLPADRLRFGLTTLDSGLAQRQAALTALHQEILACRRCALAGYHVEGAPILGGTPEMLAQARRVMLIGQAPGKTEANNGLPFSGPSGRRLFGWLATVGISEDAFRRQ